MAGERFSGIVTGNLAISGSFWSKLFWTNYRPHSGPFATVLLPRPSRT